MDLDTARRTPSRAAVSCLVWALIVVGTAAVFLAVAADAPDLTALKQDYRRPSKIPFPAENPYSDAKTTLGQTLFFDPRLSGPGTMSCATCHNPTFGWEDGLAVGVGHNAKKLRRATPTVLNLAWAELLMWDGSKDGLEDQATGPMENQAEMDKPIDALVAELAGFPGYRRLFRAAFGSEAISRLTIAQALATFERTLVSNRAPFDRWIDGDDAAIGADAQRGFVLFTGKANCAVCHTGWRFTDDGFHDVGLASDDLGRGEKMPDVPPLQHAFKTPTLRNIGARAPYMHDGSLRTLRDVVKHYNDGFLERESLSAEMHRLDLSAAEIDDLVAFMLTLTSRDDAVVVPELPTAEQGL